MNTKWGLFLRVSVSVMLTSAVDSVHAAWINADVSNAQITKALETTYDDEGRPTRILISQSATRADGVVETMTSLSENTYYSSDLSNWVFGKIDLAKETHTQGGSTITRSSKLVYDAYTGAVTQEINEPDNLDFKVVTTYGRDQWGNVVSKSVRANFSSNPLRNSPETTTFTTYDSTLHVFPILQTSVLGQKISRVFDLGTGALLSETDINGLTSRYQYDPFGRLSASLAPDGRKVLTTYSSCDGDINCPTLAKFSVKSSIVKDPDGLLPSTGAIDVAGEPMAPDSYAYFDILRRQLYTRTQNIDGRWVISGQKEVNNIGQVVRAAEPYFQGETSQQWTAFSYDAYGRLIKTTLPKGTSTSVSYGSLKTIYTNELNQNRIVETGIHGKPVKIIEGAGSTSEAITSYTYDALGSLLSVSDPMAGVRSNTYDKAGNKITDSDPNQGTWTYLYNGLSQLVKQTDAKGQETSIFYDALGRVVRREGPDFSGQWVYDSAANANGKLAQVVASNGYSRTNSYDSLGRVLKTTTVLDGQSYSIGTTYDSYGRVQAISYPTGFSYQNEYNSRGFLVKVKSEDGLRTYWQVSDSPSTNSSDAAGRILKATLGNGIVTNRSYDAKTGQATAIWSGGNVGLYNDVQNDVYLFNDAGNLQSRSDYVNGLSETFQYDSLNRLTSAAILGQDAQTVRYDKVGNIIYKSDVGYYRYDNSHAQAVSAVCRSEFAADGGCAASYAEYSYDLNGNITSGGGRSYIWSAFNKPISLTRNSKTESFAYDADYERIKHVQTDGSVSLYINPRIDSGAHFEIRKKGNSTEYTHHVYAGGESVAAVVTLDTGIEENKLSQDFQQNTNGLVIPSTVTDPAGVFSWDPIEKKLLIKTQNYADTQLPAVNSDFALATGEGVKLKVDVAVGVNNPNKGRYFSIGFDNSGVANTNNVGLRDIRAVFSGDKVYAQRTTRNTGGALLQSSSAEMGAIADNGIYTLEIEVHNVGVRLYVYPQGASRSQGYSYSTQLPQLEKIRFSIIGRAGADYGQSISSLDNLSLAIGGIKISKDAPLERYLHKDHLGSITAVSDNQGNVIERFSYDSWGKRRTLEGLSDPAFDLAGVGSLLAQSTHHGFTGHEMLDDMTLVNMNGRIYDPVIARFISADPNIDTLYSTQGVNSYSYVLNNPLNATDPTGYWSLKKALSKLHHAATKNPLAKFANAELRFTTGQTFTQFAYSKMSYNMATAVNSIVSYFCTPVFYAACNAAGSYSIAKGHGAEDSQALKIAAINYVAGEAGRYASGAIGNATSGNLAANIVLHGVRGGVTSAALGGDFRSGFITGAFGAGAAPFVGDFYGAAIVGGITSKLSGGDFATGAIVAGIGYQFNYAAHGGTPGKALAAVGGVIGKIWGLPNTIIGLVWGGIGYGVGLAMGTNPGVDVSNNAINFSNNPLMVRAMTFGNVIIYDDSTTPGDPNNPFKSTSNWTVGGEENRHTIQSQILGIFYFPAHFVGGIGSLISSPNSGLRYQVDAWHQNNFMETGPMQGRVF